MNTDNEIGTKFQMSPDEVQKLVNSRMGRPTKYHFDLLGVNDAIILPYGGKVAAAKYKERHPGWDYASCRHSITPEGKRMYIIVRTK